jgi:hypothetical protein
MTKETYNTYIKWILVIGLIVGFLHFVVEPKIPVEANDDTICAEALMFFLEGEQQITNYCIDLANRKL